MAEAVQSAAAKPLVLDDGAAFVIGNGPSLRGVDLTALSPYATVGMNAAYRYWRRIDWRPRYYACLDLVVGLSHRDAIMALIEEGRIERFLLRENLIETLGALAGSPRVYSFDALAAGNALFGNPAVTTGAGAALWAAHLGHRPLILLGIDGRYQEIVDGAARLDGIELEIREAGENPNYFFEDYQQPGDRYNLPNPRPDLHVEAFRDAGRRLRSTGVDVFNANPDSAVRCFPFVSLDRLLAGADTPRPPAEPLEPAAPAPSSAIRNRIGAFLKHSAKPLAILGLASAAAVIGAILAPEPALTLVAFFSACAIAALSAGVLYTRFAASAHLDRLQLETERLKARLAELERRSGG